MYQISCTLTKNQWNRYFACLIRPFWAVHGCKHTGSLLFTVDISGNACYHRCLCAHISGLKLPSSTHVLSVLAVFILGCRIAGIPHLRKKSPKLSDAMRDKSPTSNHVAVLFYHLVIYCITLFVLIELLVIPHIFWKSPTFFENPPHFFNECGQIPHFFQILE